MTIYEILAITIPAMIVILYFVVSKEYLLKYQNDYNLEIEKERNRQEIIMFYLRTKDQTNLDYKVQIALSANFPEKPKEIQDEKKVEKQEKTTHTALFPALVARARGGRRSDGAAV